MAQWWDFLKLLSSVLSSSCGSSQFLDKFFGLNFWTILKNCAMGAEES
jgi:hypothetical protein